MKKNGLDSNILVGMDNIQSFLGISSPTLQKLQQNGLPIVKIEGTWYATKSNLEDFFNQRTRPTVDPRLDPFLRGGS